MSWPNSHERLPVVAWYKPQSVTAAATASTDIVDMRYWQEVEIFFLMGEYAAGNDGGVTVIAYASNDGSSFTSPVAITGKAITAATFTGSAGDARIATIRVRNEELTISGTEYRYLRVDAIPTDQNLILGMLVLGVGGRYQPGSDYDIAAVAEIVA